MVLLVESNALFREGIRNMLSDTAFSVTAEYRDIAEMADPQALDEGVTILLDGDDLDLTDTRQRSAFLQGLQRTTMVVLSLRQNSAVLIEVLRHGVDGILRKDFDRETLLLTLRLVQNGERVLPRELVGTLSNTLRPAGTGPSQDASALSQLPDTFTPREYEVLRALGQGLSNKEIARELGLADGTVRVYLKTILKKLGASNRTKAAVWAVKSGIA